MLQVGFLPYNDGQMLGTVARLEQELLTDDGRLLRYRTGSGVDGLAPGEHPFLACSFWLVEQYARTGRQVEAKVLMDKLVGLVSEEQAQTKAGWLGTFPKPSRT